MSQPIFLILGYGIPKQMSEDQNYRVYLNMAFNRIYDETVNTEVKRPRILFSGGATDCFPPFKRTEAEEMKTYFKSLCERPAVKNQTKGWILLTEKRSLNTLENLLETQKILAKRKEDPKATITIFCEQTRSARIKRLSKKTFPSSHKLVVSPIDFDVSANRYLDPTLLKKREDTHIVYDAWAIKDPKNLTAYHKIFKERIDFLREAGAERHVEAVKEWWEKKLASLPIHPGSR